MKLSRALVGAILDALSAACGGSPESSSSIVVPEAKPTSRTLCEASIPPIYEDAARAGANLRSTVQDLERSSGSSGFGALLRHHRLAAGLSQEALAERARMSPNGVGALERGYRRKPQRQTLALLADALGLDGDEHVQFKSAALSVRVAPTASDRHSLSERASIGGV